MLRILYEVKNRLLKSQEVAEQIRLLLPASVGSVEVNNRNLMVNFINNITNGERTKLDNLISVLNKPDSEWREEWGTAAQTDRNNKLVIPKAGSFLGGTVIPWDARGRLLAKKVGLLLDGG